MIAYRIEVHIRSALGRNLALLCHSIPIDTAAVGVLDAREEELLVRHDHVG